MEDTLTVLPVCCRCHKVRINGVWFDNKSLLEAYGDDLSHGICPECLPILYPNHASKVTDAYCVS